MACLARGWHVNLQKPFANDLASAKRMTHEAAIGEGCNSA